MAQDYSPKIITDNLILCLDPSHNKSYPFSTLPVKGGLIMWMDAADDSTFSYSSGTTVSQWRDKSGSNYHMVPVSAGPTRNAFLNSRKVLAFTTSQQIWNSSINLVNSAYTVFCVTRLTGTTNLRVLSTQYTGATGTNWLLGFWNGYVDSYYAEGWANYSTTVANTSWKIHMGDWSGASTDLANTYSNGTAISTDTNGANAGPLGLGVNIMATETSTCEAAEIIVFNRVLSTQERRLIHTYLGQKWGILNTDRSIVDLSGNSYNGLLGNGTTANMPIYDFYNKSFRFDGVNDLITCINNIGTLSQYTICFWAKHEISNKMAVSTYNATSFYWYGDNSWAYTHGGVIGELYYTKSQSIPYGTWGHFCVTYDGTKVQIYRNSIFESQQSTTGTANFSAGLQFGKYGTSVDYMLNGNLGSFLMYNKALSALEIKKIYDSQKSKYFNNLVQDGLVLNLDAGNPTSYAGAGAVWYDTAQGLIFDSLGATQTPFTVKGGASCFAFNGSGYWQCSTGYSNVDLGGDCTIIFWFYCETLAARKTIFEKAGTSYSSYQQEVAVTWEQGLEFTYYSRYSPAYDFGYTTQNTNNSWNMMAIKMSTGKTSAARTGFYSKNGAPWTANYTSNSNTALVAAGPIIVGNGYAGVVTNGAIGQVMCYNRMLSDAEILQNYNATKGRFKIL